jgi:hypothetical protein
MKARWPSGSAATILTGMLSRQLRTGLLLGLGATCVAVACGSDDGSKKVPPSYEGAGQAGAVSGGAGAEGGEPGAPGGSDAGGVAGSGANVAGEAGSTLGGESGVAGASGLAGAAGAVGAAGAAGAANEGPRECPSGTADCDDDHADCETNTASDPLNCGRCERACGATAACTTGLCDATVLLDPSGESNYCDAVFSATTAYMVTCWGGFTEVRRTPLVLGASILGTQLATYSLPVVAARGMLIDGNDVLFGVEGSPSYLYKFPLDADGPEDVSVGYTFENGIRFDGIRLVGDTFYWSHNTHTAGGQIAPGTLKKRAKAATVSTTLVTGLGLTYTLQVFDSKLVWLEKRTSNTPLGVYRAPLAGALVADVELVTTAGAGSYMIRHGAYAYWTDKVAAPSGRVRRLLVESAAATPEDIATGLNLPEGIAADDQYVYFKQLDALYRAPLGGGAAEQLSPAVPADDSQATQVYGVDDKYVYFAAGLTGGNSQLVRVAK